MSPQVIMKKNKHIDDLFKEGFKNFEATPSPQVWENIQAKLKEKDDRKVIPFWFKFAGVAALLALLFMVGNSLFNAPTTTTNYPIVNEDATEIIKEDKILETENESIASEEEKINFETIDNTSNRSKLNNKSKVSKSSVAYKNEVQKNSNKNNSNELIKVPTDVTSEETSVANDDNTTNNISDKNNKDLIIKETIINENKEAVATENVNSESNSEETNTTETIIEEENKKSIFDAINETSEEEVAVVTVDNKPDYRWEVAPNVGPVFYNSLSEGSSIDPNFTDNQKNNDVNITYGVNVSYSFNNRLSLRAGISNVNLSYSTSGLELGTGPVASSTSSIEYPTRGNVTIPVDKGTLVNQNPDGGFGEITPKSTSGEVLLNQKISYYEMPLELKYALLNKKFGINIIGGFSTLLLGENEINVNAGDYNEVLGEASNLSSLSFTTNLGLGLNYSFSKKLMFNVEPMFKYQLNPYTDSSVDFKPYYIGIYSGLSFKF